ncbi:MAG: hypothetical protein ACI9IL_000129 [Rickettsiales bacterium]|jgi:hypothetical protein
MINHLGKFCILLEQYDVICIIHSNSKSSKLKTLLRIGGGIIYDKLSFYIQTLGLVLFR